MHGRFVSELLCENLLRVCGKIVERVQSIPIEPTDSGKGDF